MSRQGGLGLGLSALIPAAAPGQSGLVTLRLDQLVPNPRQPRADFDEAALQELADSIRLMGLLQPILVRPSPTDERFGSEKYEIIAGERRFRAAGLAGLDELPAVVRHTGDEDLLTEALVENIHRTDLNALEEALAYRQLLDDFGLTHEALAARLGKSRSAISNSLRLLSLPPRVQERVVSNALSAGHARTLAALDSPDQQERVAQRIVAEGMSVRATEDLVRKLLEAAHLPADLADDLARGAKKRKSSPFSHVQRRLSDALGTKAEIKGTARRGRIVIDYAGRDDLERLLEIFGRGAGQDLLRD